jgi:predicted nucleic acid-binding protein
MKLIVDTSESFSFFNARSKARELSLNPSLDLYAPEFSIEEIFDKRLKIISSFSLTEAQFLSTVKLLKTVIRFVELREYKEHLAEASKISPDPEDIDFFALALKTGSPIWSEDKPLKKQTRIPILSTNQLKGMI